MVEHVLSLGDVVVACCNKADVTHRRILVAAIDNRVPSINADNNNNNNNNKVKSSIIDTCQ